MGAAEKVLASIVDYLEFEDQSEAKHEYHDGYIVNMAGGTWNHGVISASVLASLSAGLAQKPCTPASSDVKVLAESANHYFYPDALVICGKPEFDGNRKDIVKNPTLIVEVLSDSTESYDRGGKFQVYRSIPSLKEYVLVSQQTAHIEAFFKNAQGIWQLAEAKGTEGILPLYSLEMELALADVYAKVDFEANEEPPKNEI